MFLKMGENCDGNIQKTGNQHTVQLIKLIQSLAKIPILVTVSLARKRFSIKLTSLVCIRMKTYVQNNWQAIGVIKQMSLTIIRQYYTNITTHLMLLP